MKIEINGQEVDFQFEHENSLEDIVEFMLDWSVKRRLILYSCFADELEFLPEDIPNIPLESIKVLNFEVKSHVDVIMLTLSEAGIYCDKLIELSKDKLENEKLNDSVDTATFSNIEDGLGWIVDLFYSASGVMSLDLDKPLYKTFSVSDFIRKIENSIDKYSSLTVKEIVEIAQETKEFITSLMMSNEMGELMIRSIDSPDELISKLFDVKASFSHELDNIEQIAVLLQSGKDAEAIKKLNEFIEFVYVFMRVCAQFSPVFDVSLKDIIKDDVSLEEKIEELKEKLFELASVMENNDMIGLADILEYEIKPTIEDMQSYTDILLSKVETTH